MAKREKPKKDRTGNPKSSVPKKYRDAKPLIKSIKGKEAMRRQDPRRRKKFRY